ncbi:hypothetical protein MGG_18029 [Pyricularia oryzae 70-15]|uniref:Uncharacterized protein n=3 Tax=Pyricularia oryzae TaxID=318829 RepID=G5EH49_PYRO7|nr:uncharacterized protein MGG_18029 [Pyricularia oryzae 70-15]EAQ70869.1 hypothetical protein MGCH7_ch7g276 [Pyricularia oryzae 70-15]EHA46497.1 hypothetical protein MGG_18029 [Pyricularia oryzae 70-15]ELQ44030.1 hypothetical protein OOU_Y34scaffold00107g2 [Pyricularia oryzae Y34]
MYKNFSIHQSTVRLHLRPMLLVYRKPHVSDTNAVVLPSEEQGTVGVTVTSDWQKNNTGSLPATITFGTTLKSTNLAMPTVFVQWMVLMGLFAPGTRPCIWTRPKRCRNS